MRKIRFQRLSVLPLLRRQPCWRRQLQYREQRRLRRPDQQWQHWLPSPAGFRPERQRPHPAATAAGSAGQLAFPNLNPGGNNGNAGSILRNNAGCLAIIGSFIIPLIGVVLYFVYRRKNNMQAAKKVLYAAIAGVAFNLLINFVGHGSQYSYFHNLMGY